MCGDCWNATMAAPAAVVAARFAWVGHRDRIPFLRRRGAAPLEERAAGDEQRAPADGRGVTGVAGAVDQGPACAHVGADDRERAPVPVP